MPNAWAIEDLRQPTPLADKYLATKDAVYVALDTAINVVIKVFDTEEDGKVYVKKFPMPPITLPYYPPNSEKLRTDTLDTEETAWNK